MSRKSESFIQLKPNVNINPKMKILSIIEKTLINRHLTFSAVRYYTGKLDFILNILCMIIASNLCLNLLNMYLARKTYMKLLHFHE